MAIVEQRQQAVLEVMYGLPVSEVARRYGVTRQSVHRWLRRYAAAGLADHCSRPAACPHQMPLAIFDYIERFHNPIRRHSTLGQKSPIDYELAAAAASS